ncbi:type II toxin-antitoxin system RelE/ParE family toxin (plasmid) [Acuticoccus sp. MNP-M23]|uniref:type II toxin-antitoxin system RelE/ParE family toxin n=1 Tax=Acuticoccus sp. MNP-M23 TaxID=3072793 RepID=UPI0028168510|nr:type II toxin-antitoxin system RelE/ParE family toxin [Acuticoccus sp. MNP-M23]WMS45309.1 type II toxin-antitoxin system RelE/ParE family toxin [Acuticoccus sp. MNP-M23]WMS45317.1 type II toxin-antitoxin system RelE/ParE family toxin [Acuticoccus sp. MNP-M23]
MESGLKKLPAVFYRSASGTEPVRDWLRSLDPGDRNILGHDIGMAEFGWPVGMPLCRSLGGGLWEVRSNLTQRRIARVIFCVAHGRMVLLHGFIKKAQKTPAPDLNLARTRQKEIEK